MSFITRTHLSRRTFLHGVGVTLALPFLDSMVPALARGQSATAALPRTRLGCIYFPHGAIMPKWTPATDGAGFELSEILQPLKPFYSQITVVSDLEHKLAYGSGATANHNRSAAAYLSAAFAKTGATPQLGITMDQVVAQKLGQDTPLPSLELMIEGSSLNCGDGLSCSYRDTISWQGPSAPLPMQNNPQVVFERLFGDGTTADLRKARRQQSISLLDSVTGEVSSLQRKLPTGDRSRLDQYLTDVREIERRVQKAGQQLSEDLKVPPAPTGIPSDVEEHIKLMLDLQVLAWQAEITRVTTFLLAKELSTAVYAKSNVRDAFHTLSHHSNIQENKDRFAVLNRYHVTLFAYLLDKLHNTPDGNGTLLEHSMVLYGSGMSDGNQHNHTDLPIVVAGGASGKLKGGRHLRHPKNTPMANLLVAMLHKLDIPAESFGDSQGAVLL
ncbi:MAG TPA: DUF1552 domain-containing protein [Vicinamibacterales bacterium]|nr:DUF1552 domain-containing protein [Vicinamibacterales bacterium]